jgi:hypothetical protein
VRCSKAAWIGLLALSTGCGGRVERTRLEGDQGGAGGASAGTAGAYQGGGGIHSVPAPLVPLVAGHRSTFAFTPLDPTQPMAETCADPVNEIGSEQTVQTFTGFRYESFCNATPMLLTGSGDALRAYPLLGDPPSLGPAIEYIHFPVRDGESWWLDGAELTWASVPDSVTVPAGTFWNCWVRLAPPGISTLTYCRGAGLVTGVHEAANWRLELVGKNF